MSKVPVYTQRAQQNYRDSTLSVQLTINPRTEELLYERKMLTVPQMETVIGKKDFKEWVGDMVETIPGKPTLVPESDKREALILKRKAGDVFSVVNNENNI